MGAAEPGPPAGARPSPTLARSHPQGGAQCPGLGWPWCPPAALLLAGAVGWALAEAGPALTDHGEALTPLVRQHHGAAGPHSALTLVMCLGHHSDNTKEVIAPFEPNKL